MLDWDDLRIFLSLARHRTLVAAAKELRVTQSTVGRRIASLQASMGMRLLHRTADGYVLTMAGQSILEHVERVEREALSVQRVVNGHEAHPGGTVRLSSNQLVASHVLAPCLSALQARNHAVTVELLPPLSGETLAANEIDVAVQLRPFECKDLVVRRIGTVAFGLYGCGAYLERSGDPDTADGCPGHQLVTTSEDDGLDLQAAWLSEHASRGRVFLRSDSYETQFWATVGGGGLGLLPRFRGDTEPSLRLLSTHVPVPGADIWMAVHRENRDVPRVRAVLDCVAKAVKGRASVLEPNS